MCCDSELICKGSRWSLFPPDIIYRYIFINLMFSPCHLNNKPQIKTRYSTWQPSHVTYRLLPLTVALNSSHQAHTHHRVSPDPLHQLLSKLVILELYRTNLTFRFILQSKFHAAKHQLRTQNITSNFREARLILPEDGSQRIRNMSGVLIVF